MQRIHCPYPPLNLNIVDLQTIAHKSIQHAVYDYYKMHYDKIEKRELYKWEAIVHFQKYWDIEASDFPTMLEKSLRKTRNLMSSGNYYPRKMIVWAAKKEPEKVRELFRMLYDLSLDVKVRIEDFRTGINSIVEKNKVGAIEKSYQDHRAVMVYLNMKYPEKYYLYKYQMFTRFADLIDYAELPKPGDIDLLFIFESMCDMILKRVMQDEELLNKYESRRSKYYDPEYHLLVQDIVYSAIYFDNPQVLDEKNEVSVKNFTLYAKQTPVKLQGAHVDYIHEAKTNKELGEAGEEFVYQYERQQIAEYKLSKEKQVRRVAKLDGDGLGYDILSYDKNGNEKYIEVKTTSGLEESTIFITANELEMSEQHPEQYYLYRVFDFDKVSMKGKISIRKGSLKDLCVSAQMYKVDFK